MPQHRTHPSRNFTIRARAKTSCPRLRIEKLEERDVPAGFLFVEFGDNFPLVGPNRVLTSTIGALRDFADDAVPNNKILGTVITDSNNASPDATAVSMTRVAFTAAERAQMIGVIQRAYTPLDITVVELTPTAQTLSDGRNVAAATSLGDMVNTLRGGNAAFRDAYIIAVSYIVDPGGATQQLYTNGGGNSPSSPTLGVSSDLATGQNNHDDVAHVYADSSSIGGDFRNTMNNIAHEAGHCFGLQHSITNAATTASINLFHQAEIMSYRNTNNTSSSMFTRYPMIRGDGNSPGGDPVNYNDLAARPGGTLTLYDQLAADANVLANPNFTFVSGTGAHDIITISLVAGVGQVTVVAFPNNSYTAGTEITVPSVGGTTYQYNIPLNLPILVYGGDSDDRFVIDADLGATVNIDGMRGNDSLVVMGKNVPTMVYAPGADAPAGIDLSFGGGGATNVTSYNGMLTAGGTTIQFLDFETTSSVSVQDVGDLTFRSPGGTDNWNMDTPAAGQSRVQGTVNGGVAAVPLTFFNVVDFTADTGNNDGVSPGDIVTVTSEFAAAGLQNVNVNTGLGNDELILQTGNFALPVAGGNFSFNGGPGVNDQITATADVDFTLSDTSLQSSGGGSVQLASIERADLTGGANVNAFVVGNWTGIADLDAIGGGDSYDVTFVGAASGFVNINDTGALGTDTVVTHGTAAADTLGITNNQITLGLETINYAGVEGLTVNGDAGSDTFNVRSTLATTPVIANGGLSDDTFRVSSDAPLAIGNVDGIAGALLLDSGAGAANRVIISDFGGAGNGNVILSHNGITGAEDITGLAPVVISYQATGSGTFTNGATNDGILIRGSNTSADAFHVRATLGGSTTKIEGAGLNDVFRISSNAGIDDNGHLNDIAGLLTIDAGTGTANRLIVSDFGRAGDAAFALTTSSLTRSVAPALTINYGAIGGNFTNGATLDGILIRGSNTGVDAFGVTSTMPFSSTRIQGNGGADTFTADFAGLPPQLRFTADGGAGVDRLTALGSANADGFTLSTIALNVRNNGLRYLGVEQLIARGGNGNDSFSSLVSAFPAVVQTIQFFGEAGNETAVVAPVSNVPLLLDGGAGTDKLTVQRLGGNYVLPLPPKGAVSGTLLFSNRKPIQFISWELRNIGVTQYLP